MNGLLFKAFPSKLVCAFLIYPIRATCHAYFIFLDLITLITFGEG